jgi:hypothetical protein
MRKIEQISCSTADSERLERWSGTAIRPANEERPRGHHDARLQAQRHHDPLRSPQHAGRPGYRNLHAAPPTPRVTALSQANRSANPGELKLHLIVDNYAAQTHPRFLHFTPTSASWLNMVERFFAEKTRKRIRRGVFKSVAELKSAIVECLEKYRPKPPSSGHNPPAKSSERSHGRNKRWTHNTSIGTAN